MNWSMSWQKALRFGLWGGGGAAVSNLAGELLWGATAPAPFLVLVWQIALWFGLIGLGVSLGIVLSQQYYLKKRIDWSLSFLWNALFGFIAGAIAGALAQALYAGFWTSELWRVVCWGIAGALLGVTLSARIPNLKRLPGFLGGLGGGLVGGGLFLLFTLLFGNIVGRFVGVASIGLLIAIAIVTVESLFREAWLEVIYGPGESRTVSLGQDSVILGSEPGVTLYIQGIPAGSTVFRLDQGQVFCDQPNTGQTRKMKIDQELMLGKAKVIVRGKTETVKQWGAVPVDSPTRTTRVLVVDTQHFPLPLGLQLPASTISTLKESSAEKFLLEVVTHPQHPGVTGLKNRTSTPWKALLPDGKMLTINPGKTLRLVPRTQIDFGPVKGEIV